MTPELIVEIISGLFFLLFLYAAFNKILDFQKFKVQLGQSPLLTDYAMVIAWLVPTIEILICILLYFKRTLVIGLYASFSLMLMFTLYIIVILTFAERVPCSCGGILEKLGWTAHLIFNIIFVFLAVVAIFLQGKFTLYKSRVKQAN
ncbi:hypothetical protein HQN84_06240 [Pedobacter steynii]|nr:hypothetical protein [Pedobacter steynii]